MNNTSILLGVIGRGRGLVIKTLLVKAQTAREQICVDRAATSHALLLPILGGTPITATLSGGRDLLLATPTD